MEYSSLYYGQIKTQVNQICSFFNDDKDSLSFLRFVSSLLFNLKLEEIDEILTDGYDDLGADVIYFNINEDEMEFDLEIIQGKYNKNSCDKGNFNSEIGEEVINKFKNIFDYFFGNLTSNDFVNGEIKNKKIEYNDLIEKNYTLNKINFYVSHLGTKISERSMEVWDRWVEPNHFRDNINLINLGLIDIYKLYDESRTLTIDEKVTFYGKFFEFSTPDVKGFVSTINGKDLVDLFEKYGNKLFQKNIRYSLGENLINKKIIQSATDDEKRDKFWFLNNGITIVCKKYTKTNPNPENMTLDLKNFQVVNGAQTTTSLKKALEKIGNIDQVKVVAKVFQAEDDLAEMITDSTNSQNPVTKRDLRSNDEIQKLMGEDIRDLGYYYQRKRNQFIQESDKNKIIDNYDFAQRFYSFFREKPAEARNKKAQIFSNETIYTSIFNSNLNANFIIFTHKSFLNLLSSLRELKLKHKRNEIQVNSEIVEISQRAKFHLFFAFKVFFEKSGLTITSNDFLENEEYINKFQDLDLVINFLNIINESTDELLEDSTNKVKIFQKSDLAIKIKEKVSIEEE
ncbi:MAG: AIPR family protein [Nanoarchaeota archaeon]|nr:AIPR family protein [Nanoarchaeota archaeon]